MPRKRRTHSIFINQRVLTPLIGILAVCFIIYIIAKELASDVTFAIPLLLAIGLVAFGWLHFHRRKRLRVKTLGDLLTLSPTQFEQAIADLLHDLGYRHVQRVGKAGDLAADICCRDKDGRSVVVQCKRYAPGYRIGSPEIQTFIGMITVHHGADRGIFVTTSAYTQPAMQLASRHGITLIDGTELTRLIGKVHQHVNYQNDAVVTAHVATVDGAAPTTDTTPHV